MLSFRRSTDAHSRTMASALSSRGTPKQSASCVAGQVSWIVAMYVQVYVVCVCVCVCVCVRACVRVCV